MLIAAAVKQMDIFSLRIQLFV